MPESRFTGRLSAATIGQRQALREPSRPDSRFHDLAVLYDATVADVLDVVYGRLSHALDAHYVSLAAFVEMARTAPRYRPAAQGLPSFARTVARRLVAAREAVRASADPQAIAGLGAHDSAVAADFATLFGALATRSP